MEQFELGTGSNTNKDSSNLAAAIALCVALFGIATASILTVVAQTEMSSNAITFNRLGIATLAFSIWNRIAITKPTAQSPPTYSLRDISLIAIAGVSFAVSLIFWAWSLTQTSVANSTLLNNMMPIFTTVGAWLLFGQSFPVRFLLGMAVALGGAIAIGIEDLHVGKSILGDTAALLAAMFAAFYLLSLAQLRLKFATPVVMQWTNLVGSLCVLPLMLLTNDSLFPVTWGGWLTAIALAVVCQVIGQGLIAYSLARYSAGLVAVLMLMIPAIAAILAMVIFAEKLSLWNWLMFSVVLGGIYIAVSAPPTVSAPLLENEP